MKTLNGLFKLFLCSVLTVQTLGCSSFKKHEEAKQVALVEGRCDDALKEVSKKDPGVQIADTSKQVAGTILSYSLTGVSYTTEVLWDFAGGTIMFIGLCSPQIAAAAAGVGSTGGYSDQGTRPFCFPGKLNALSSPPLGRKTHEATKSFRCPSVVPVSESIRAVAACYIGKGDQESLVKARQSVNALQGSTEVFDCLPKEEKDEIEKVSQAINLKMITPL